MDSSGFLRLSFGRRLLGFPEEAGAGAGVAGRAELFDLQQEGISVAIDGDGDEALRMPGALALAPERPNPSDGGT